MAVLSTQLQAGPTVQLNGDEMRDGMADSGSLGYVGGNTRVGVSINRDLEGQVDLNQIIMEDDSSATSAEGWFGYKIKDDDNSTKGLTGGGVKINHQWVNDEQDTVHKVFGAYDRDVNDRAKATVGYGQETEDLFWSGHVSKSISEDEVHGALTTRAYDIGVGAQVGTFLDSTLTRIRGGLDYEFGTEFADGEDRPGKATLSAGIEQFFHDSPHSITLDVSGNQVSGGSDTKSNDFGARLGYRYEFGGDGVYRSAGGTSRRRVEIPGSPGRPGRAGVPGIPATRAIAGRPAIPATRGTPGRAAVPGRPGRAAVPPRYERRAVNAPGHEFVKTTMKLENETFFKLNSSKLTQSAKRNLDKIIGQIRGHGYLGAIRITGNTCGLGDPAYDQRLSENRANSVRDYLVDKGFNPSHLIARGLGKGSPKYDRRDDDFRNRRVDLEYVTERSVKKAANKTQYRNVLVQEGRPAVQAIPGRPAVPARAGHPGRPAVPGRAGHPGRPAIPAIAATPGTPSRFVWRTEVVPAAPVWIQRAIRNTISHNKSISTYTTRTATKTVDDTFTVTDRNTTMDVLANDSSGLTLVRVTQPANGTVTIVNDRVVFVPNPGFSGTDEFTYTVVDTDGNEITSRVTVDVPTTINNAPVAVDDSASTNEAMPVMIDVLLNDSDSDGDAITISNMTNPANGTVQLVNGQIQYTPNANFTGTDTFTYTITDGNNNQTTATVNVVVADVNQAPNAVNDNSTTPEGTPVTVNVISNDTDPEGDALEVMTLGQASNGTVSIVNNQVVYTPNAGFTGTDSFTYVVSDGNGNSTTATVNIIVTDVKSAPVAVNDARTTPENTAVTIPVLGNDTDADGDTLSIVSATNPSNGSVSVTGNDIIYTPVNGFSGQDTFDYTITDNDGNNVTATVTVTVTDVNMAPAAVDDARTTPENTAITIPVLGNDSDPDGDTISIVSSTTPSNGSVTVSGNDIIYTPDNGYSGQDTFDYTITDGQGNNVTATVTITITDVNVAPTAVDDARTTPENTPVTIPVLGNDSDADGDTLSIVSATNPANGSANVSGNGIVYTPDAGFFGQDTFDYTITDNQGNNVTATVTVTVTDVKMAPTAVDDAETTDENTAVTINVLGNDTDPDGDTLSLVGNTAPTNGTASISGGNIVYTPTVGFSGTDTFDYTITDTDGNNVTATVTVTVNDVNYPPMASDDSDTTPEDTPITINVLGNDGDIDGDTITITNVGTPTSGTATFSGSNVIYTPNAGFVGTDTFTYTINDGNGHPVTANVTVTVTAVNKDPIAVDDTASTPYETPVTIDVAANDSDPDGTTTCVNNIVTNPSNGSVSISGNGTDIIYTPNPGFTGTDSFVYTACDADGGTDTATVNVTVGAANQPPIVRNNATTTPVNTAVVMPVVDNDTDPDGDTLTITATTPPSNGSITVSGNDVTYTPSSGYVGVDSYTYTVSDGNGNNGTATATVTIQAPANQPPVLIDDNFSATPFDTPVTMDVTNNDSDPEGDTLTVVSTTNPSNGTVSISGNNVVYTPNPGHVGPDSYTYTVSDGNGNTATATASVNISAASQGLNAVNDSASTDYQTPVTINVASNDINPDGGATCVNNIDTNPSNGFVSISSNGQDIMYTPNNGFTGTDSFVYTACDSEGDLDTATVTITVGAANQPPVLSPNYAAIQGYFPVTIRVLADDSDPEGDTLTIVRTHSGPSNGSVNISGNDVIYEANNGYVGADVFYYEVSDGNGNLVSERVDIDVKNDNVDPVVASIPNVTANPSGSTTMDISSYLSDADGDSVYVAVADALGGTITFSGTVLQYTPNYSEVSSGDTDTIYITVSDGQGGTGDGVITVHIP